MRYRLLDTLRGFSLASMILYHTCWDLVNMYGFNWPWFIKSQGYLWQQSICWLFIFVSGFCIGLKRDERTLSSACKRGLAVMVSGILVTVVTLIFAPEAKIIFGVLFFLGFSIMLTVWLRPLLMKIPERAGLLSSTVLLFIFRNINDRSLGFENIILCRLPDCLYEHGMLGTFLGLQDKNFSSADYFSFIPWYFLFIKGYFICLNLLRRREKKGLTGLPDVFNKGIPVLETLGRHSLLVYLLHQPLILLLLSFFLKPVL
jgi:uncharacterized membrane protein